MPLHGKGMLHKRGLVVLVSSAVLMLSVLLHVCAGAVCHTQDALILRYPHRHTVKQGVSISTVYPIAPQVNVPQQAFLVGQLPQGYTRLSLNATPVPLYQQGFVLMVSQREPVLLQVDACTPWQVPLQWGSPLRQPPQLPTWETLAPHLTPLRQATTLGGWVPLPFRGIDALDMPPLRVLPDEEAFRLTPQAVGTWVPVSHKVVLGHHTWLGLFPTLIAPNPQNRLTETYWLKEASASLFKPAGFLRPKLEAPFIWSSRASESTWQGTLSHRLPLVWDYEASSRTLALTVYGVTDPLMYRTLPPWPCHVSNTPTVVSQDVATPQARTTLRCKLPHPLKGLSWGVTSTTGKHPFAHYQGSVRLLMPSVMPSYMQVKHPLQGKVIVLDAGHGGKESGAVGMTGVQEKTLNLQVVQKLATSLKGLGATVYLTHLGQGMQPSLPLDVPTDLKKRVRQAQQYHPDVFVSIHHNALPDGMNPYIHHGTETYWFTPHSECLASKVHHALTSSLQLHDNGIWRKNLAVIRPWDYPSILLELGSMIHPQEYLALMQATTQTRAVKGMTQGVLDFFKTCTTSG
ncbi:MAG: N-acetylmuramoyl-L-alanine amidase [Vampirovibrionales bacterium]